MCSHACAAICACAAMHVHLTIKCTPCMCTDACARLAWGSKHAASRAVIGGLRAAGMELGVWGVLVRVSHQSAIHALNASIGNMQSKNQPTMFRFLKNRCLPISESTHGISKDSIGPFSSPNTSTPSGRSNQQIPACLLCVVTF